MNGYSDRRQAGMLILIIGAAAMAAVPLLMTIKMVVTDPLCNTCRLCKGVGEVEISTIMKECPGCDGDGIIE